MDEFVRRAVEQIDFADALAERSATSYRTGTFQDYLEQMAAEARARLAADDGTDPAAGSSDGQATTGGDPQ